MSISYEVVRQAAASPIEVNLCTLPCIARLIDEGLPPNKDEGAPAAPCMLPTIGTAILQVARLKQIEASERGRGADTSNTAVYLLDVLPYMPYPEDFSGLIERIGTPSEDLVICDMTMNEKGCFDAFKKYLEATTAALHSESEQLIAH